MKKRMTVLFAMLASVSFGEIVAQKGVITEQQFNAKMDEIIAAKKQAATQPSGVDLIKEYKTFSATAYTDSEGVERIGYESSIPFVKSKIYFDETTVTPEYATSLLMLEIDPITLPLMISIDAYKGSKSKDKFSAAITSVAYHTPALLTSDFIRKINAEDVEYVSKAIAYGQDPAGSYEKVKRQLEEANLYRSFYNLPPFQVPASLATFNSQKPASNP